MTQVERAEQVDNGQVVYSFGEDPESPFGVLKDIKDIYRGGLKDDFEALAREWIKLRLKGPGPVSNLRETKSRLDAAVAQETPEFILECMQAFAKELGVIENTPKPLSPKELRDRQRYLDHAGRNDPVIAQIITKSRYNGGFNITYAAAFFLRVITDLEDDHSRVNRLGAYLIGPASNNGLVLNGFIDVPTLLPVYCEWLVGEYHSK